MEIIPAIDLKDGNAIRLTKGLITTAKTYSKDVVKIASFFEECGVKWLHIVDIDGAFKKSVVNFHTILKIRKNVSLKIQVGGGIKNKEDIKRYLDIGIDRVILGSLAIKDAQYVKRLSEKYPISLGVDVADGFVAYNGWEKSSKIGYLDYVKEFNNSNVETIICTDISKDGMLNGLNGHIAFDIAKVSKIKTILSGGLRDINDIKKLKKATNIKGVIVGKAIYESTINLKDAIKLIRD